jgi:hypothetical protein
MVKYSLSCWLISWGLFSEWTTAAAELRLSDLNSPVNLPCLPRSTVSSVSFKETWGKMKVLPVVVVVVLAFVVQVASDPQQCGAGAADAQCANNLCCSKWGFCGSTDAYCGDGCQSGPCQTQGPEQCGAAAADAQCANNLCCSKWGFCGSTDAYCGDGCQNGPCTTPPPSTPPAPGGLGEILSESLFNSFFPNRNKSFYSYESFIKAAKSFPEFAATGDKDQRKREVAAFCANVCQETSCRFQNQSDSLWRILCLAAHVLSKDFLARVIYHQILIKTALRISYACGTIWTNMF